MDNRDLHALRDGLRGDFARIAARRRTRIAAAIGACDASMWRDAAAELHVLAGEAAILAFDEIAKLAELAREAATRGDETELAVALARLDGLIEEVSGA